MESLKHILNIKKYVRNLVRIIATFINESIRHFKAILDVQVFSE